MLLVEKTDVPAIAVVLRARRADIDQRRGQQLAAGLLVHLVVGFRLNVVAADPHHAAAAGHVVRKPLGGLGIERRQVHAEQHLELVERFGRQVAGQKRRGDDGPAAGSAGSQGLFQVVRIVEIRNLVAARLDDGDGNALVNLQGEEAAVVVLRAVVADQPHLAAVQSAAVEREGELVLRPAQRRQIQLGAARLPDAVDQQFDHPLLRDGRSVQQRGGGLHRHARHGHRRLDVDSLHGDVRLRRAVAVDDDDGERGEGERGRGEGGEFASRG